ncbi:2793_t:CDS:10 [Entrophospora sp. SA101]|nr:2793_t:CDS:10 [Entrophospora sp. SA101]
MPEAILIICDNIKSDSLQETDLLAKGIVYNKSIRNNQKDIYKILKKRNLFNKLLLSKDDIKFAKYKLSNPSKEFIKAFVTDGNLRIGENDEKRLHCSLISFMCQLEFVWHKPSFQDYKSVDIRWDGCQVQSTKQNQHIDEDFERLTKFAKNSYVHNYNFIDRFEIKDALTYVLEKLIVICFHFYSWESNVKNLVVVVNEAFEKGDYDMAWEDYTKGLIIYPTDPILWYNRSMVNSLKGFPELTIMDAKRSLEILERIYKRAVETYERAINEKKEYQKKLNDQSESMKQAYPTLREFVVKNLTFKTIFTFNGNYPWDDRIYNHSDKSIIELLQSYIGSGLTNDNIMISPVNSAIDRNSNNVCSDNSGSDIDGSSSPRGRKVQQLGIVAKRNISKGLIVFQEVSFISTHRFDSLKCDYCHTPLNNESKLACVNQFCSDFFCTLNCNQLALQLYHSPLCGNGLYSSFKAKTYNLLQIGAINNKIYFELMLTLKLFSIAKIRNICPLDIHEIKYLSSIIKSNVIQLNSTFQKEVVGLFPIAGFINHTCSNPNIRVRNFPLSLASDNNTSKLGYGIIIEACKDIMKGQEILMSYCDLSKIEKLQKQSFLSNNPSINPTGVEFTKLNDFKSPVFMAVSANIDTLSPATAVDNNDNR